MQIRPGFSYHIKNSFFDFVQDNALMSNKENGHFRPHFLAIQDDFDENIYWMIPISSKVDKYQTIMSKKQAKYGKCDTIVIGKFAGEDRAFLIQNAFPIIPEYFDHIHTINDIPVTIHQTLQAELETKLKKIIAMNKNGVPLFFSNVNHIMEILKKTN